MYTPQAFQETDLCKLHDWMERSSFALLVSGEDDELVASHLPLLLDRSNGELGTVRGHMARANPQWESAQDRSVMLVYSGPHAYISPTWYQADNVVPTWNYVAVHAYGTLEVVHDADQLLEIVRDTVDVNESGMPSPWSLDSVDFQFSSSLLKAIVGFRVRIERLEGKTKLNQNHDVARRQLVVQALQAESSDNARAVAELIEQTVKADSTD